MYRRGLTVFAAVFLLLFVLTAVLALGPLDWQRRKDPDRQEGTRWRKKGANLELLSASILRDIKPSCPPESESDRAYLTFYIADDVAEDEVVSITVREFRPREYCMQPDQKKWGKGWRTFSWPTSAVLDKLEPESQFYGLGAIALLGKEIPYNLAPIILHRGELLNSTTQITAYRFVLRPPDDADLLDLSCEIYSDSDDSAEPVGEVKLPEGDQKAGKTFFIDWISVQEGKPLEAGWYQISLTGELDYPNPANNVELDEIYLLYHQPVLEMRK